MARDIIEKYGQQSINEFWYFVDQLNFNCSNTDADTVRVSLLKKLSPSTASRYRSICDAYAYKLHSQVSTKGESPYLYASYEAVSRGKEFYTTCTDTINTVAPLLEQVTVLNHFGNVFPTDDDYYGKAPTYTVVDDHDDDYEE